MTLLAPPTTALLGQTNPVVPQLLMYVGIFLVFYFILFRPQQTQRKKLEATLGAIKKGDEVVTAGGIVGEVLSIKLLAASGTSTEDRVTIRSGDARLIVERGRIARITTTPATSGAAPAA